MSSTSGDVPAYKGKVTNRSWAQLPEELVRVIATYYIWDISVSNYCPDQWQQRVFWQNRMVYTALRDAQEVERFMSICPQWGAAMESHMFWMHAIALIDPHDTMAANAWIRNNNSSAPPVRASPFQHFRTVTRFSCFVCRINSPNSMQGLGNAKRLVYTPYLGYCGVCRDHDRTATAYCGLCFRERQTAEIERQSNPYFLAGCLENEDLDMWPNVEATCRSCRSEWLWRSACSQNIKDAVGGQRFRIDDWEAKNTVDNFIDLAEGRIADVLMVARERHWIRTHTKLGDMLSQALAASRFDGREERFAAAARGEDTEMDLSDPEDDDEDDYELAQLTEDSGIRDLALGDWARNRILDGFWISPGDQWWGHIHPDHPWDKVRAQHPCPWTVEEDEPMETGDEESAIDEHPKLATVKETIPPSHPLCEQSFRAFQKQMRILLLPAMKNVVRRLVIECGADGIDPAIRATRMNLEDVMKELRDEATWFDGVDWLERRRNAQREAAAREEASSSDDHSTSSSSGSSKSSDESSTVTSPVLSTTTLQTTPSPPPLVEGKKSVVAQDAKPVMIAVTPVLNPPRLIHPIPHVPVIMAHMPVHSVEAFKMVWREACAPLYHCRCKICERAQAEANAAAAAAAGVVAESPAVAPVTAVVDNHHQKTVQNDLVEIRLEEAAAVVDQRGREEEVDYLDYDDDDDEFDSDFEDDELLGRYNNTRSRSRSPPRVNRPAVYGKHSDRRTNHPANAPLHSEPQVSPRKRSCDEIDDGRLVEDDGRNGNDPEIQDEIVVDAPKTPPKRIRTEGPASPTTTTMTTFTTLDGPGLTVPDPSKAMLRKRSSEVLDMDMDVDVDVQVGKVSEGQTLTAAAITTTTAKRAKMSEEAESPPTSFTAEDSE
ncbi:hypothetical protein GYMLUDRAFT_76221 [Collybiopsis luxurians FD-317 M1]|uniref:Uncharacterized protein n=1 Tax=Collybiopsis luxurians FD-317 M1 TaxID=944289 RepID=A0A0D0CM91_9AGAR|nr:hypothetical protein GYMLUDRAFT_76221 [Collybiopsis luxurians FD-317 M1]